MPSERADFAVPVARAEPVAGAQPVAGAEPVADAQPVVGAESVAGAQPVECAIDTSRAGGMRNRPDGGKAREELAARQLSLVASLVAGGTTPAGVDEARVKIQAVALLRKRWRSVGRKQPELAAALGTDFWPAFQSCDSARTGPPPDCSSADARDFARYLTSAAGRGHATPEVRRAARVILRPWRFNFR